MKMSLLCAIAFATLSVGCTGGSGREEKKAFQDGPMRQVQQKTEEEQRVAGLAEKYLTKEGFSTEGLDSYVALRGAVWEIWFSNRIPNRAGGPGYLVRIENPTGKLIDIPREQ